MHKDLPAGAKEVIISAVVSQAIASTSYDTAVAK